MKSVEIGVPFTVYGEAYAGSCQGMSKTYGPNLKFIAFDVQINDCWLDVPRAEEFVKNLGLEFVYYTKSETKLELLDALRDAESQQAIRNGMGSGHKEEGIVIRPLTELTKNNGERVIAKHKRLEFMETSTPRPVDSEKLKVLADAQEIANDWCTDMRLTHVLDKIEGGASIEKMGVIIKAMLEDIKMESEGEISWSREAEKAIQTRTAQMAKKRFMEIKV